MENSLIKNIFQFALNINVKSTKLSSPMGGGRSFKWNSPIILIFCMIVFFVHLGYQTNLRNIVDSFFSVPNNFNWGNPSHYLSLFLYIFGDDGRWSNIATPMLLFVIVGPITEDRLGSIQLAAVILVTAFVVGLIDVTLFRGGLYGPLCIAYLLIFLATFVNVKKGDIPLSFILMLIIVLFVGAEQWTQDFGRAFPMIIGSILGMLWAKLVRPVQLQNV